MAEKILTPCDLLLLLFLCDELTYFPLIPVFEFISHLFRTFIEYRLLVLLLGILGVQDRNLLFLHREDLLRRLQRVVLHRRYLIGRFRNQEVNANLQLHREDRLVKDYHHR